MTDFLQLVKQRVVVYDGAMGTNIQKRNPTLDDYWGKENCSEVLVLSRPDIIRDIHADFFRVGCDIVETNTFGGTGMVLASLNCATKCARSTSLPRNLRARWRSSFLLKDHPRFVAGSMGPTTKLPSLGHIGWDAMAGGLRGAGARADRRRRRCSADRDLPGLAAGERSRRSPCSTPCAKRASACPCRCR
jgi:5-methyltetrahydrofolate--homocysteine methyltransferase